MIFKLAGAIFIISGGALAGGYKALRLSDRVKTIYGFMEAVEIFKSEISFITADMETALSCASERDTSGIFGGCAETFYEKGVRTAFREETEKSALPCEEKEILFAFANGLSAHDKESQIKNADHTLEKFERLLGKTSAEKEKFSALYCTAGILGGIAGSILLL